MDAVAKRRIAGHYCRTGSGSDNLRWGATVVGLHRLIDWRRPIRFAPSLLFEDARFSAGMFAAQAAGTLVNQGDRVLVAHSARRRWPACTHLHQHRKQVGSGGSGHYFVRVSACGRPAGLRTARGDDGLVMRSIERSPLYYSGFGTGAVAGGDFLGLWLGDFATPEWPPRFESFWSHLPSWPLRYRSVTFSLRAESRGCLRATPGSRPARVWHDVLLVPRFGLVGAAGAMLLGYSTSLLFAANARRTLRIPPAERRVRFWLGLALGCAAQWRCCSAWSAGYRLAWVLALGTAAWASFYLVRAIVAHAVARGETGCSSGCPSTTELWTKRGATRRRNRNSPR